MRITTKAAIALAATVIAGCSTSTTAATSTATTTDNAHTRSVAIVQTVLPGASTAQAEEMMRTTCDLINNHPTPDGVLGVRHDLVARGLGAIEVSALISASVAGTCPEHLDALKGI